MSVLSADLPCSTLIFVQNIFEKFQEMWTTVNQIKSKRNLEIYIKTIEKKYIIPLLQTDEKNIEDFIAKNINGYQNLRFGLIIELCKLLKEEDLLQLIQEVLQQVKTQYTKQSVLNESIDIFCQCTEKLLAIDFEKADPEKLSVFLTEVLLNRNSKVDLYFSAALFGAMNSMSNEALIKRLRKEVEIYHTQIKKFCIELETGLDVSLYKGRLVLTEEHLSRLKNYLPEEKYSWTN